MKVAIMGGGWYGCHLAASLVGQHEVQLHEAGPRLFSGASGANPARLHLGFHYPRSKATRDACQQQHGEFMRRYGHLTRAIPVNLYAVAARTSQVDFGNYLQTLRGELEFITVEDPHDFGLENVEGAVLTGERHIVIREAREFFQALLGEAVRLNSNPGTEELLAAVDVVIDCTFCALEARNIDRYEPCVTVILQGPTDRALTVMDGPFPSVYPWDERDNLLSLTSAAHTPLARVKTYHEARSVVATTKAEEIRARQMRMLSDISHFWPDAGVRFRAVDAMLAIRAMPESGADSRLVDIVRIAPRLLRVRAGKIVSIFHAEHLIREALCSL